METIQLQCGNCQKVMAISTEHLGGQVRCPHCLSVVQTPPRQQPAPAPPEVLAPPVDAGEVESIFAPEEPSDDLFGAAPQRGLVEMPELKPIEPARFEADTTARPAQPQDTAAAFTDGMPFQSAEAPSGEAHASDFSAMRRPRPVYDRSYLALMAFIFLIPYAVVSTLIIFYLMYQMANQKNDLRLLPDPSKKDKAQEVERPKHDQPLADDLKVPLKGSITIGMLQVNPLKVDQDEFGNLRLLLRVKNISTNQAFSPMHPDFLKIGKGDRPSMPYTFLDPAKFNPIYQAHLAFKRGDGDELTNEGNLRPGQEEELLLTTNGHKELIQSIAKSDADLTWRVQLRRGLVDHGSEKVSATAVIGVQFNAKDLRKG